MQNESSSEWEARIAAEVADDLAEEHASRHGRTGPFMKQCPECVATLEWDHEEALLEEERGTLYGEDSLGARREMSPEQLTRREAQELAEEMERVSEWPEGWNVLWYSERSACWYALVDDWEPMEEVR